MGSRCIQSNINHVISRIRILLFTNVKHFDNIKNTKKKALFKGSIFVIASRFMNLIIIGDTNLQRRLVMYYINLHFTLLPKVNYFHLVRVYTGPSVVSDYSPFVMHFNAFKYAVPSKSMVCFVVYLFV
jgi:hypothetical protein